MVVRSCAVGLTSPIAQPLHQSLLVTGYRSYTATSYSVVNVLVVTYDNSIAHIDYNTMGVLYVYPTILVRDCWLKLVIVCKKNFCSKTIFSLILFLEQALPDLKNDLNFRLKFFTYYVIMTAQ